ncbi:hypothetical protein [Tahibacter caeni]|uniref:hypothetical protein n=1 Tax=Tahibacter caeni TaxID=1453545 RepID=UPI002147A9C7|nr:hypothetical protein [Tahibacter caeni]
MAVTKNQGDFMSVSMRQRVRRWRTALGVLLLCGGCGAASADNGVAEAANGNAVGPVLLAPQGDDMFALLRYGGTDDSLLDRIFASRYETAAAINGYVDVVLSPDGIAHPYAPYVLFDAPSCEGRAFISSAAARPARYLRAAIVGADSKLFIASSDHTSHVAIESQLGAAGCRPYRHRITAYPVQAAGTLLDRLPPPYRVQAVR